MISWIKRFFRRDKVNWALTLVVGGLLVGISIFMYPKKGEGCEYDLELTNWLIVTGVIVVPSILQIGFAIHSRIKCGMWD